MRRIAFLFFLGCFAASVGAQPTPSASPATAAPATPPAIQPLTLAQVLDLAHRANPTLLSAGQHLSAVRAQEVTAGLRQNPSALVGNQMLTLSLGDPNGTEFYQFGVTRLFERGGKRQALLETARSTTANRFPTRRPAQTDRSRDPPGIFANALRTASGDDLSR